MFKIIENHKFLNRFCIIIIVTFLCLQSIAQEPIQTDRPDQTEGVFIVPKHYLQIESAVNFEKNNDNTNSFLLPTNLIKYGLLNKFEIQMAIDELFSNDRIYGTLPIAIGFKANLFHGTKYIPEIALISRLQFKSWSKNEYQISKNLPMFRLAFQNVITKKYSIGYNFGMNWEEFSNQPSIILAISNSYNISAKTALFAEIYNIKNTLVNQQILDFGIVQQLSNQFILDCAFGKHLNNIERNYYMTIGITTRLKLKKN